VKIYLFFQIFSKRSQAEAVRNEIAQMQKAAQVLSTIAQKLNEKITSGHKSDAEEPEKPRSSDDDDNRKRKLSVEGGSSQEPRKKRSLIGKIFGNAQKRQGPPPTIREENGTHKK
jgi:hypothetical protein